MHVCVCVWISLGHIVCVKVEKKEKQTQTEHNEESSWCCVRKYEFNTFLLISKTLKQQWTNLSSFGLFHMLKQLRWECVLGIFCFLSFFSFFPQNQRQEQKCEERMKQCVYLF